MAKKKTASSAHGRPQKKSEKYMKDSELELDDIPELTSEELSSTRRFGRQKGHALSNPYP
ncbi:MAG: hypothetical protein H6626_10335 [Pseudobdellovibrionaceae bacterium]|nr:MAG: hypothetical protein H6626_10335 [Pseudobdellovibrionaceae bacterium]